MARSQFSSKTEFGPILLSVDYCAARVNNAACPTEKRREACNIIIRTEPNNNEERIRVVSIAASHVSLSFLRKRRAFCVLQSQIYPSYFSPFINNRHNGKKFTKNLEKIPKVTM